MPDVEIVTLDPAHFHAALIHQEMLPGVQRRVHIYAPPGPDIDMHLERLRQFNTRRERPTTWDLRVTIAHDFMQRFLRERPGQVVVLAGRNRTKIDTVLACVEAGYHVLADKPLIIAHDAYSKLDRALAIAHDKQVLINDMMTERFEITSILQRQVVLDQSRFGTVLPGTPECPAVRLESVHGLKKKVAGTWLRRPVAFFDVLENGESLADVGTHLVDLAQWLAFPGHILQPSAVTILAAQRWPTRLSQADLFEITGQTEIPTCLPRAGNGQLLFPGNNRIVYRLHKVHVEIITRWEVHCPFGDTHFARLSGSRADTEVRQTDGTPRLFLQPRRVQSDASCLSKPRSPQKLEKAAGDRLNEVEIAIADELRTGHEAHFQEVFKEFLTRVRHATPLAPVELGSLRTKYWTTTTAIRESATQVLEGGQNPV